MSKYKIMSFKQWFNLSIVNILSMILIFVFLIIIDKNNFIFISKTQDGFAISLFILSFVLYINYFGYYYIKYIYEGLVK